MTANKLEASAERNLLLAASLAKNVAPTAQDREHSKPTDLVKVYENLLQITTDLRNLYDEEALEAKREAAARFLTYKAYRTYYLALSFGSANKWLERYFWPKKFFCLSFVLCGLYHCQPALKE